MGQHARLVEANLAKGERLVAKVHPSRWGYFWSYALGWVLCGIPILLAELQVRSIVYYVTNKRIIYERTLFSKQASTFTYKKITDIHLTQSFIGRSVKVGNIYINTAGTPFMELKMKGVKKPFAIKRSLDKYYSEA